MLPKSYKIPRGLCLNNSPQIWLIGNQRDRGGGGSLRVFRFYWVTKGFLTCLNEQVEWSLSDRLFLNKSTTLLI